MHRRIELENYRSIAHAQVALAPFTVVVGPNGSGKSSFADAFIFMRDIAYDAESAISNRGGIVGLRRWSRTKPRIVRVAIDIDSGRKNLRHAFSIQSTRGGEWRFKKEEILVTEVLGEETRMERQDEVISGAMFSAPGRIPATTSAMLYGRQLLRIPRRARPENVRRCRLDPPRMREPQLASDNVLLDESGANIATALRELRKHEAQFALLLAAMRRIVPGLVDVSTIHHGRYLSLEFSQRQAGGQIATFTGSDMSEGSLRALGILAAALQIRDGELLIIEEPEVHIQPGAARVLFEVLKSASEHGSVLITTHSPEILDAAQDEEILVCALEEGVTRIGPLAEAQRALVRDGLLSIAELLRAEPLRIEGQQPQVVRERPKK